MTTSTQPGIDFEGKPIQKVEQGAIQRPAPADIGALLNAAIDKEIGVESLEKLVSLYREMTDYQAALDFNQAMAAFQDECPPIPKQSTANITTKGGTRYSYNYAELDAIARIVKPLLSRRGLSYSWDSSTTDGKLSVTCTVRHVAGHSVSSTFQAPIETVAPVTGAQKVAMALTYGRRQSLIQVLGLETCDPDTDGGFGNATITGEQADEIQKLIDDAGADVQRFLAHFKISGVGELAVRDYAAAVAMLRTKKERKK